MVLKDFPNSIHYLQQKTQAPPEEQTVIESTPQPSAAQPIETIHVPPPVVHAEQLPMEWKAFQRNAPTRGSGL